jgi:hypothetical protein
LVSTSLSYRYWNNRIFQPSYFFVVTPNWSSYKHEYPCIRWLL